MIFRVRLISAQLAEPALLSSDSGFDSSITASRDAARLLCRLCGVRSQRYAGWLSRAAAWRCESAGRLLGQHCRSPVSMRIGAEDRAAIPIPVLGLSRCLRYSLRQATTARLHSFHHLRKIPPFDAPASHECQPVDRPAAVSVRADSQLLHGQLPSHRALLRCRIRCGTGTDDRVQSYAIRRKHQHEKAMIAAQISCCSLMISLNWRPSVSAAFLHMIMRPRNISK